MNLPAFSYTGHPHHQAFCEMEKGLQTVLGRIHLFSNDRQTLGVIKDYLSQIDSRMRGWPWELPPYLRNRDRPDR